MEYMNPSYENNSVGSSNSGGINPGVVGDANGVNQPVSNVISQPVPPMQSSPQDQFGQFEQQIAQQPISSGEGDIYLGGDSEQKSKKGLVIGVVLIIILAIVAGIVAVLMNSGMFTKTEQQKESDLATAYNSFANYVLYGEESTEKVDFNEIGYSAPYFESLAYNERGEYIEKARVKYNELKKIYNDYLDLDNKTDDEEEAGTQSDSNGSNNESNGENELKEFYDSQYDKSYNIELLKSYYVDLAEVNYLTTDDLTYTYIHNGINDARALIEESCATTDSEYELYLYDYLTSLREMMNLNLDSIVLNVDAGCVADDKIIEGCYTLAEAQNEQFQTAIRNTNQAMWNFEDEASQTMKGIFYLLYGVDGINDSGEGEQ